MVRHITTDELRLAQHRLLEDKELFANSAIALGGVCKRIEARAADKKPAPKMFEMHHEFMAARDAMMIAISEGKTLEECEAAAVAAVGLS